MPYVDFPWPLDKLPTDEQLFEPGGLDPYIDELLDEVVPRLRRCIEQRILSCLERACTCPLRLQIKVGCWNTEAHGQDEDPDSDHPEDVAWEPQQSFKLIELRAMLGSPDDVISCGSGSSAAAEPPAQAPAAEAPAQAQAAEAPAGAGDGNLDDSLMRTLEMELDLEGQPPALDPDAPDPVPLAQGGVWFSQILASLEAGDEI